MKRAQVPALINSTHVQIKRGASKAGGGGRARKAEGELGRWGVESQKPWEDSFSERRTRLLRGLGCQGK